MNSIPPVITTDRACLKALPRRAGAEDFRPLVGRYLALVYSSALRRTGDAVHAVEVTKAVFLVLARRARKMRRKTVLAGWLFHVTAITCRKLKLKRPQRWVWVRRAPRSEAPPDAPLWTRVAPEMDVALDRLPPKQRRAVLLLHLLNYDWDSAAPILRTSERRAQKRAARGLKKLARRLRVNAEALALACAAEGCAAPVPEGLAFDILQSIEASRGRRPAFQLARCTLSALAWTRWRRRFLFGVPAFLATLALVLAVAWHLDERTGHSRLISEVFVWSVKHEATTVPGLAEPARPWPANQSGPALSAALIHNPSDLYRTTNIWQVHLNFSRDQWKALEPRRIAPLPNFLQPDGTALLRNPQASRSGLSGVLGFEFNWAHADFEIGGVPFTNVAARFKGNGTYISSLYGSKRAFKVDLNKFTKGQKLAGADEFDFHNLVDDHSFLSDALAYEFFRDAGVPAPRTAYAWLTVSVSGQWDRKPLGLYVMVEPVNAGFAAERFGSKKTPVFKPVTYRLFEHLGDDWPAYAAIYDLKTQATPEQQRRVIDLARLVSQADDAEFAARLGDFLDLDEFARFLAGEVLLSSYDSFLSNGQNFYVYLDPRSNKFGFIPWDLDLAWGGFFILGTTAERERASLWHPWVGQNRFLERVLGVEEFRQLYRAQLEDFSTRLLVPERLNRRIDELAAAIRGPVAAESAFRLRKFEQAVSDQPIKPAEGEAGQGANRPAHQIKKFIEHRARSVRQQLDGKSKGVILQYKGRE